MNFELLKISIQSILAHKLRSILTLLGILVGVFSIILVMSTMRALQGSIETEISSLGANTVQIKKWPTISFGGPGTWEKY